MGVYGYPMKKIMGCLKDWRHERRIAAARRAYDNARYEGAAIHVLVALWNVFVDRINARSPEQVERMERRMGLR